MSEGKTWRAVDRTPGAIWTFGAFYVAFALASLANNLVMLPQFQDQLSFVVQREAFAWLGVAGFGLRLIARLALAWFIVRHASSIARWLVLIFALPWIRQAVDGVPALLAGDSSWWPWAVAMILQVLAPVCLGAPSARYWLSSKRRTNARDVETFN